MFMADNGCRQYDVAAYVWPAFSGNDPRTRLFWHEGIGEWQTVKSGPHSNEEYFRLRKPLWGYVNEADPAVMEMEIDAAASHGVNVFIYDWYWYDDRPFLENCLNDGYLKAHNNDRVRFYIMWANHDAGYTWDIRNAGICEDVPVWRGATDLDRFKTVARRLIGQYFHCPSYYRIDGKPVFAIYDIGNLITGLGGVENTKKALDWMREECIRDGLSGLHLQLIRQYADVPNLSGVDGRPFPLEELFDKITVDSTTHYQYVHFCRVDRDYAEITAELPELYRRSHCDAVPYFPHVSVGWNNDQRFCHSNGVLLRNNTPAAFEKALLAAKMYLDSHPSLAPLVTVNSWNEWTENSYLQPGQLVGYGYLEAIRRVFGEK